MACSIIRLVSRCATATAMVAASLAFSPVATFAGPDPDPTVFESPIYVSSAVAFPGGRSTFYAPHGVGSRVAQGSLVAVNAGGVEIAGSHWPEAFFARLGSRPHYLIVTSGDYSGLSVMITGTDAATNYIALAEDVSSEIVGTESFRIREALTLNDMFGSLNEAGFVGSNTPSLADTLHFHHSGTTTSESFFNYRLSSLNTGWVASTRARTPSGHRSILPFQIVEVRRLKSSPALAVYTQQQVRSEGMLVPVPQGRTFVGTSRAQPALTLANSGLGGILASGSGTRTADFVEMFSPSYTPFYHINLSWRNNVTFAFAPDEPLAPGAGVALNKRAAGTVLWAISSDLF